MENRPKAPEAFKEELQRGFDLISQQPEVGAKATNVKLKNVRRIHLSRIRYFLYYRVRPKRIEVLALWHGYHFGKAKSLGRNQHIQLSSRATKPRPNYRRTTGNHWSLVAQGAAQNSSQQKSWEDEVLRQLYAERDKYAAELGFDLDRILQI